ncbi:hypothetical protein [uncultured Georgenia sp.]|nr:hypothetical protein [uncultured Georgenia sp.]
MGGQGQSTGQSTSVAPWHDALVAQLARVRAGLAERLEHDDDVEEYL